MDDESLEQVVEEFRTTSDLQKQIACSDKIAAAISFRIDAFVRKYLFRPDNVDDVVQTIWLKIVKEIDKFSGQRSFAAWCQGIAVNTCNDEIRRRYRDRIMPVDPSDLENCLEETPEEAFQPAAYRDDDNLSASELVKKILNALPTRCQKLLQMYFIDELMHREIGEALSLSENTVRVGAQRCLHMAREMFEKARRSHA